MNKYKIPCTAEQIKKAKELGAPLEVCDYNEVNTDRCFCFFNKETVACYRKPTAEEMIGWLRDMDIFVNIIYLDSGYASYIKTIKENKVLFDGPMVFLKTYEESVLSAIDEALKYLSNKTL